VAFSTAALAQSALNAVHSSSKKKALEPPLEVVDSNGTVVGRLV
jgi:hypothetical protein